MLLIATKFLLSIHAFVAAALNDVCACTCSRDVLQTCYIQCMFTALAISCCSYMYQRVADSMDTTNSNGMMDTSSPMGQPPPDIKPDISQLNVSTSQPGPPPGHPYAPPSSQPGGGYPHHPATSYSGMPGIAPPYYNLGQFTGHAAAEFYEVAMFVCDLAVHVCDRYVQSCTNLLSKRINFNGLCYYASRIHNV